MPPRPKVDLPGYFHVLNRAVRRDRLFDTDADYAAFIKALGDALRRVPTPLIAYCVMPNHFHLLIGPVLTPQLSVFMHRLTVIHSKRWHRHRGSDGSGPVYQGRFKAIPVTGETHFVWACRYVERNPIRAGLVERAEQWPWSSASRYRTNCDFVALSPWPIPKPSDWIEVLNEEETGFPKKPGFLGC